MKALAIAGLACAAMALAVSQLTQAAPAIAGAGLEAATAAKIDALLQGEVDRERAPGISIAIARGDLLLYARGYGQRDLATHAPARADTVYAIGSITKQFTAAAILLLQQDGKLSIDDKLSTFVPELRHASNITLRELLNQRSGLPDYTGVPGLDATKGIAWRALVAAVNGLPPESAPGTAFRYNNLNYLLLGKVIERVSGMPYARFIAQRIVAPLDLNATGASDDASARAVGYTRTASGFVKATPWSPSLLGGAGVVTSSATDLVRWDAALQAGRVVDRSSRTLMETPASDAGYAMGWVSERDGGDRLLWHNGEVGGFHAMNAVLADRNLYVAVLTNVDDLAAPAAQPEELARRIIGVLEPSGAFGEAAVAQEHAVPADPVLAARVAAWVAQFEAGAIDRAQLTPGMAAALTPQMIRETAAAWAPLGKPTSISVLGHEPREGMDAYVLRLEFAEGPFVWKIAVTPDGKLAGAGGLEPFH